MVTTTISRNLNQGKLPNALFAVANFLTGIQATEDKTMEGNIGYIHPTPEEFRLLLEKLELSSRQAGEIMGTSERQVRRYKEGITSKGKKTKVPFSSLYLLLHKTTGAQISQNNWRNEIWVKL